MYDLYLLERENKVYVQKTEGFYVYELQTPAIYLSDVFILKNHRGENLYKEYEKEVADIGRENNCEYILTTACINDRNFARSNYIINQCGYSPFKGEHGLVWYKKEL